MPLQTNFNILKDLPRPNTVVAPIQQRPQVNILDEIGRGLMGLAAGKERRADRKAKEAQQAIMQEQAQIKAEAGMEIQSILNNPDLPEDQREDAIGSVISKFDPKAGLQFRKAGREVRKDAVDTFFKTKNLGLAVEKFEHSKAKADSTFGKLLRDRRKAADEGRTDEVNLIDQQILKQNAKGTGVTVNVGDPSFKVPSGFMLKDPKNPEAGVAPIPGGPADKLTVESASKAQALKLSRKQIPAIKNILFNKDGKINRSALRTGSVNVPFSNTLGIPFTEGSELATLYEVGIQAITRGETGAAMPPEEVDNTRKRFQPGPLDSDKVVGIKMNMFDELLNGTLKLIRPDGSFDSATFDAELLNREKTGDKEGIEAKTEIPTILNDLPEEVRNHGMDDAGLRSAAEEAIAGGASREEVEKRLELLLKKTSASGQDLGALNNGEKVVGLAGSDIDTAEFEGIREKRYFDTVGVPTIGVGFNLRRKDAQEKIEALGYSFKKVKAGQQNISKEDAKTLFQGDLEKSQEEAKKLVADFDSHPPVVKDILTDLVFNLGARGFSKFKRTRAAIDRGDYKLAAAQLRRSKWYKQVGRRSKIITRKLEEV